MHFRNGRLSGVLFLGIMLLPMIALLMMDFQVRKANDITGSVTLSESGGGFPFFFILLLIIAVIYVVVRIKRGKTDAS